MPPKGKKGAPTDKKEDQHEEPLQAVLFTDSFETRFRPLTLEKPRCLLPICGTPLLECSLEFLAQNGVEHCYVYLGSFQDEVEAYLKKSKWSSPTLSPFKKLELIRNTSASMGDAMRDLDSRAILNGDFLLVHGDLVSNLPLSAALKAHKARRAADKNAIMTMVLREAGVGHRTKAQETRPVFVIDPTKNRCLHFEQMSSRQQQDRYALIDSGLVSDHDDWEVREDLIDCGIDIATQDYLALWSDNFDFQAPRKGFLHSVLKDYELNGKLIHAHIVQDHYAARVRNLQAYDAVSRDILSRWTYPLSPDSNLLADQTFRLHKGNLYREEGVILSRSSVVGPRAAIGRGSSVGDNSKISDSVIGRNCFIGRNVTIEGAYLWDNVTVQDGAELRKAIVANEATVGKKAKIQPGAIVSFGVTVAEGVTVDGTSRITRKRKRQGTAELEQAKSDPQLVGESGVGTQYDGEDEEDQEEPIEGLVSSVYNMGDLALSVESISTLNSEDEFAEDHIQHHDRSAGSSFVSIESEGSDSGASTQHAKNFDAEAASSIYDALVQNTETSNISLELQALRLSSNASEHQVRRAVAVSFMKRISSLVDSEGLKPATAAAQVLGPHKQLWERTMFDKDKSGKVDQVDMLLLMQSDLRHRPNGDEVLNASCMKLYAMDEVIEADGFLQWWSDVKSAEDDGMKKVRAKTQSFIDFLGEDSDEEDDEEEEEDDDDDDDD